MGLDQPAVRTCPLPASSNTTTGPFMYPNRFVRFIHGGSVPQNWSSDSTTKLGTSLLLNRNIILKKKRKRNHPMHFAEEKCHDQYNSRSVTCGCAPPPLPGMHVSSSAGPGAQDSKRKKPNHKFVTQVKGIMHAVMIDESRCLDS